MFNTQIQVLKQTELLGQQFEVYGTPQEPLFKAQDVARMINHSDVSMMMRMIDEDEKLTQTIFVSGQNRELWFLTEDGLYEVLMQSRKPIAKEFKKGVKLILKQIRQTGGYMVSHSDETPEQIMARALLLAQEDFIFPQKKTGFYLRDKKKAVPLQCENIIRARCATNEWLFLCLHFIKIWRCHISSRLERYLPFGVFAAIYEHRFFFLLYN